MGLTTVIAQSVCLRAEHFIKYLHLTLSRRRAWAARYTGALLISLKKYRGHKATCGEQHDRHQRDNDNSINFWHRFVFTDSPAALSMRQKARDMRRTRLARFFQNLYASLRNREG